MDQFTESFITWMDSNRLQAAEIAERLIVTPQAVYNWRSSGIPARRKPHVEILMRDWDAVPHTTVSTGQNLVLQPTPEQFDQWSQAALKQRKTVHQWAIDGLEALAENTETDQDIALVAEEVIKYNNQKLPKTA